MHECVRRAAARRGARRGRPCRSAKTLCIPPTCCLRAPLPLSALLLAMRAAHARTPSPIACKCTDALQHASINTLTEPHRGCEISRGPRAPPPLGAEPLSYACSAVLVA